MKRLIELKTVRVSQKGQISIPASIRKEIGIKMGDELFLVKRENRIMLEKPEEFEKGINKEFKDLIEISEESLKKLWLNKEDEIWNTYLKRGK